MLILTRRISETLCIGDNIEVTVLAVTGNQVRLGVKAPRDVVVDREEVAERKRNEQVARAKAWPEHHKSGAPR